MSDVNGSTDWDAALSDAAQTSGAPLAHTPGAFADAYGPVADQVSAKTGIDSNTILGQWGLETGWGKSVIPGTNNLGNIKSTKSSGAGVSATDNQTGSNDSYQKFGSLNDFADHYADLINNRYQGATNTGADAQATAQALKAGGYAEDPHYAPKVVAASQAVSQARGGTNWDALLGAVSPQSANAQSDINPATGLPSLDSVTGKYQAAGPSGNPIVATAAGLGEGLGTTMLGAQALAGKGLTAIGSDTVGPWLTKDAQTGAADLKSQADQAAGDSGFRTAGNLVGSVVPALAVGPEALPQAALGAGYSAGNAALKDQPILPAAVEGAGLGIAGVGGAKVLGAAAEAASPLITRAKNAITGGSDAATAGIAGQLGDQLNPTIDALRANSDEIIPGSLPTAAEAANNPAVVRIQRQMQNTAAGQEAFPARQAANTEARFNAGDAVVGPDINAETAAFTQQQADRVAAGQAELAPINQAQADAMQTPAYASAITDAKTSAANAGSSVFVDQQGNIQRGLRQGVEEAAGTPESLEAARNARSEQARMDYGQVNGAVSENTPGFRDLMSRPEVVSAINESAAREATRQGLSAPRAFTQAPAQRSLTLAPNGELNWVEQQAPRMFSNSVLAGAKAIMEDDASSLMRAGKNNAADATIKAKNALTDFLSSNNDAYRTARSNFAAASEPIDQQAALQQRLNSAIDPVSGRVDPNKLRDAITSIQREQAKPGIRAADRVTDAQLNTLATLSEQARRAPNNLTGLPGEGQETLRQALVARAEKGGLNQSDAQAASDAFRQYLADNSPAYKKFFDAADSYGVDLQSRQQLAQALDKLASSANSATGAPNMTFAAAKSAFKNIAPDTAAGEVTQSLLADLQRSTTANAALGAAGSQTAANANLGGGLIGKMLGHKFGDEAVAGAVGAGHVLPAIAGAIAKKAFASANAKTEAAAIDLLLNPKKLADALEKYKSQPQAKEVFIKALKDKANGAGKAGIRAVQAFEASHS